MAKTVTTWTLMDTTLHSEGPLLASGHEEDHEDARRAATLARADHEHLADLLVCEGGKRYARADDGTVTYQRTYTNGVRLTATYRDDQPVPAPVLAPLPTDLLPVVSPAGPVQSRWWAHGYQAGMADLAAALTEGGEAGARRWLADNLATA